MLRTLPVVLALTAFAAGQAPVPLGFTFKDVAREAGLTAVTTYGGQRANKYLLETTGCGVAMLDYDNDGLAGPLLRQRHYPRRISAGPEPTSHLYRNRGDGTFEDVTAKAGLALTGWGQGACAGDYDNDGFVDLFVTFWGQNRLFHNRGDGTFEDVTASAGLVTATTLGRRLRLRRLRPRRPPRSVRRQLHRLRSEERAGAGLWIVPL